MCRKEGEVCRLQETQPFLPDRTWTVAVSLSLPSDFAKNPLSACAQPKPLNHPLPAPERAQCGSSSLQGVVGYLQAGGCVSHRCLLILYCFGFPKAPMLMRYHGAPREQGPKKASSSSLDFQTPSLNLTWEPGIFETPGVSSQHRTCRPLRAWPLQLVIPGMT